MQMKRAYSRLDITKMWDDDEEKDVTVTGTATTPTPDRMRDIVDPMGARFAKEMPLLWQHDHHQPVGLVSFGKATKAGIPFTASIPRVKEAGRLKERIDEALHSLKYKLVGAVSIGFSPDDDGVEWMENDGLKFTSYEVMELSLVTIPANADATIDMIKSIDRQHRAATGKLRAGVPLLMKQPPSRQRSFVTLIPRHSPPTE